MAQYRFDGENFFNGGLPPQFNQFFQRLAESSGKEVPRSAMGEEHAKNMFLDGWLRGMLELDEHQAQELDALVEENNESNPASIIGFGPATGAEHQISIRTGGSSEFPKYSDAWSWVG